MILKFQLNYEDVMAFQKDAIKNVEYHKKRSKIFFILLELFVFFIVIYGMTLILPQSLYFENPALYHGFAIGTGILIPLVFAPFINKVYTPMTLWQYKQLLKNRKDKKWPRNMTLTLAEEGVEMKTDHHQVKGHVKVAWSAIQKVSEDENFIFLYFEENDAIIIPYKTKATKHEEQVEIRRLLNHYLKNLM